MRQQQRKYWLLTGGSMHAGLEFFPGFLNAERRAADDRAALEYHNSGR